MLLEGSAQKVYVQELVDNEGKKKWKRVFIFSRTGLKRRQDWWS